MEDPDVESEDAELGELEFPIVMTKLLMTTFDVLERLAKEWNAPIYAFFKTIPTIEYVEERRCHSFICAAKHCLHRSRAVRRYLDKRDANSTSNMRKHAKKCWGEDVVAAADNAKTADEVRDITVSGALNVQSITTAFARKGKGKVTYSHRQHTKAESR